MKSLENKTETQKIGGPSPVGFDAPVIQPNSFINGDCMEFMRTCPPNFFDLAIVDPPYGKNDLHRGKTGFGSGSNKDRNKLNKKINGWGKPSLAYFQELTRVSKNQIIWGGNYFLDMLRPTNCFIIWDKENGDSPYADAELAWTSFNKVTKIYRQFWLGSHIHRVEEIIHPTQKPIALYKWTLNKYAKEGDLILDTHVGSASSLIACVELGFDYIGFEIDKEYYDLAKKRLSKATRKYELDL